MEMEMEMEKKTNSLLELTLYIYIGDIEESVLQHEKCSLKNTNLLLYILLLTSYDCDRYVYTRGRIV